MLAKDGGAPATAAVAGGTAGAAVGDGLLAADAVVTAATGAIAGDTAALATAAGATALGALGIAALGEAAGAGTGVGSARAATDVTAAAAGAAPVRAVAAGWTSTCVAAWGSPPVVAGGDSEFRVNVDENGPASAPVLGAGVAGPAAPLADDAAWLMGLGAPGMFGTATVAVDPREVAFAVPSSASEMARAVVVGCFPAARA